MTRQEKLERITLLIKILESCKACDNHTELSLMKSYTKEIREILLTL